MTPLLLFLAQEPMPPAPSTPDGMNSVRYLRPYHINSTYTHGYEALLIFLVMAIVAVVIFKRRSPLRFRLAYLVFSLFPLVMGIGQSVVYALELRKSVGSLEFSSVGGEFYFALDDIIGALGPFSILTFVLLCISASMFFFRLPKDSSGNNVSGSAP